LLFFNTITIDTEVQNIYLTAII